MDTNPQENEIEQLNFSQALNALEPLANFIRRFDQVHKVIASGAGLYQALGETERVLAQRKAELDGVSLEIVAAQQRLTEAQTAADEFRQTAQAQIGELRGEIDSLVSQRAERVEELKAVESNIAKAKAQAARILAG